MSENLDGGLLEMADREQRLNKGKGEVSLALDDAGRRMLLKDLFELAF